MVQSQCPDRQDGQKDGQKDGRKDRQTIFYMTLPKRGPKSADHIKRSNISSPMSICLLQATWKYKAK